MRNKIDKTKIKVGYRISFMYWGDVFELQNKRFTGDVVEGPDGLLIVRFNVEDLIKEVKVSQIHNVYFVRKKKGS